MSNCPSPATGSSDLSMRILCRTVLLSMTCGLIFSQVETPFYADKQYLLAFIDSRSRLRPIRSPAEWEIRRMHILANMERVMGALPKHPQAALDVHTEESQETPDFFRKRISFISENTDSGSHTDRVTAFLMIPKSLGSRERAPAMLCLHQTTRAGKSEPAGLAGKADLHYAAELAARGYVTLAPDYPNFGDYVMDPYAHGYASATMKGIVNHRRAIDLLESLSQVDPERIGVIGHSLGGHNSLFLAVFEPRVRAVVTSCGFNSFFKYMKGDLTGWSHKGYMPRIATQFFKDPVKMPFDFTEVLASIAPRPVFINAPLGDTNFEVSGVRDCVTAALPVYHEIFGARERLEVHYPQAGHEFSLEVREAAYRFLDRWLR